MNVYACNTMQPPTAWAQGVGEPKQHWSQWEKPITKHYVNLSKSARRFVHGNKPRRQDARRGTSSQPRASVAVILSSVLFMIRAEAAERSSTTRPVDAWSIDGGLSADRRMGCVHWDARSLASERSGGQTLEPQPARRTERYSL